MIWKLSVYGNSILFLAIAVMLPALTSVTAAQEVEISVNAPPEVKEGETFTATIDVNSVTELDSAQFVLSFDSNVINVTDVKQGEINGETLPDIMWNFKPGYTNLVGALFKFPGDNGVNGSGCLAELEFEVKGKGRETSKLEISEVRLYNIWGKRIDAKTIDAEIRVRVDDDEEPDTTPTLSPTATQTPITTVTATLMTNATVTPKPSVALGVTSILHTAKNCAF